MYNVKYDLCMFFGIGYISLFGKIPFEIVSTATRISLHKKTLYNEYQNDILSDKFAIMISCTFVDFHANSNINVPKRFSR